MNRIIELDSVDSTNLYAERLLKEKRVPGGTVVWAHEQTAGKGQGENKWLSEPFRNLTLSMILFPGFLPVDRQFLINKAISLGVVDLVHALLPAGSCRIKWPNDICHGRSKIGGILINNTITGNTFDTSIIGIGINVNQTRFDPSLPGAVSVAQIIRGETDLEHALHMLIEKVDIRYGQLQEGAISMLDGEYKSSLSGFGEEREFKAGSGVFKGTIKDVDQFGRLVVETTDQKRLTFSHGEIEFLF